MELFVCIDKIVFGYDLNSDMMYEIFSLILIEYRENGFFLFEKIIISFYSHVV